MMMRRLFPTLLLLATSQTAFAGVNTVPEPETLALLAIGAAAVAVVRWRNAREHEPVLGDAMAEGRCRSQA
jgi:hypothetical protein